MATPPSQQDINSFIEQHSRTLAYPEARKRLLRDYFFTELKEIEGASFQRQELFDDFDVLNSKINRLAKVVGGILTQLP
jgi:hypothetical protein